MPSRRGVFALSSPNLAHSRYVGLDRWSGFQMSFEHLYLFTPELLERCGKQPGFDLCECYGGGSGAMPARENLLRSIARSVLRFAGLLPRGSATVARRGRQTTTCLGETCTIFSWSSAKPMRLGAKQDGQNHEEGPLSCCQLLDQCG